MPELSTDEKLARYLAYGQTVQAALEPINALDEAPDDPEVRRLIGRISEDAGSIIASVNNGHAGLFGGADQLVRNIEPYAANLAAAQAALTARLKAADDLPEDIGEPVDMLADTLNSLIQTYVETQASYQSSPPDLQVFVSPATATAAPAGAKPVASKAAAPATETEAPVLTPLTEVIQDETSHRIFRWPFWTALRTKSRGGFISITADDEPGNLAGVPLEADDFFPMFDTTIKDLVTYSTQHVREAIRMWLRTVSATIQPQRNVLKLFVGDIEAVKARATEAGAYDLTPLDNLRASVEPETQESALLDRIQQRFQAKPIQPSDIFPLARKADGHEIGLIFGWSPNFKGPKERKRHASHLVQAFRYRDEFVSSASLALTEWVSEARKIASRTLWNWFGSRITSLEMLLQDGALLEALAAGLPRKFEGEWVKPALAVAAIPGPDVA